MVKTILLTATILFSLTAHATSANDPLPSWHDRPIKKNIIQFVKTVVDKNSQNYVPVAQRIATIDHDGTLWVEQPIYTQVIFAFDRIKALAAQHPEWKEQEPYQSILKNNYQALTLKDIEQVLAVTHSEMTVEAFKEIEKKWLVSTKDRRFHRYYTQLVYQPMLEVIHYLLKNDFKVYIVSGGGQDFIRAFSQEIYHIPSEQVIGTAGHTSYVYQANKPQLIKTAKVLFIDDKQGKPEAIHLFIGKKPIIAFGNSDGDREMLEWTQSNPKKHLMLLVHHDDAKREYAYDTNSKVGTFSKSLMEEAKNNHWQVISMKLDWKTIFPKVDAMRQKSF